MKAVDSSFGFEIQPVYLTRIYENTILKILPILRFIILYLHLLIIRGMACMLDAD